MGQEFLDRFLRRRNAVGKVFPKYFYHFTDERNYTSICESGLLSLRRTTENGIDVSAPGGNALSHQLDRRLGLDAYVHLSMHEDHPMLYDARQRGDIDRSVILRIEPEVILIAGVKMTSDVANKNDVELLTLAEAQEQMDLEAVFDYLDWKDPEVQKRRQATKKYELLVPDHIPFDLIEKI